MLVVIVIMMKY